MVENSLAEQVTQKVPPENFRGEEPGYFPDRIVKDTVRLDRLRQAIDETVKGASEEQVGKRLFDLIVHNCYGRVFPNPNSAGDFIGTVDSEENPELENCIVLITVKGKLAVVGGFNDIGESIYKTISREAAEETGARSISHFTVFGQESNPIRDERFVVVSTCAAGIIDPSELAAMDDAEGLVVVRLINQDGSLNQSFFTAEAEHTDARGKKFSHQGIRADHKEELVKLYHLWNDHKRSPDETLADVLKRMSTATPQEWFEGYSQHPPGADQYEKKNGLLLTPNIKFALEKAREILGQSGLPDSEEKAEQLVRQLITADVLPLFPQAAVTTDCLIVRGDKLIVQQLPDGRLALPGGFYSPEADEAGKSLAAAAQQIVFERYGADFRPRIYAGAVGGTDALGYPADPRYPRLSHVFVGVMTDARLPTPIYPPGSKILEIPIWQDRPKKILSEEITKKEWGYDHNLEIVIPLLTRVLQAIDPTGNLEAEQVIQTQRISI